MSPPTSKRGRARARPPSARAPRARPRSRPTSSRALRKAFEREADGNPLAIPWPTGLDPAAARRIIELGRLQHRIWSWTVALSLLALLIVTLLEFGPLLWGWHAPSPAREHLLVQVDLAAFFVLVIELFTQLRAAKNKLLFLRTHWLLILALLPLGVIFRAVRVLEGLHALRALQVFGKLEELRNILPALELPLLVALLAWTEEQVRRFASWSGLSDLKALAVSLYRESH